MAIPLAVAGMSYMLYMTHMYVYLLIYTTVVYATGAFHTDFMEPAVGRLKEALALATITTPRIPVISNVDAQPHYTPDDIRATLARQVTNPVRWETIISTMVKAPEFDRAYELGPGTVCRGIVKRYGKKINVINVLA